MNQSDKSNLLMLCGALHDIEESCRDGIATWHITDIRMKIEKIIVKSLPKEIREEIKSL